MAKADVHTSDFSRPESQNANECKTKIKSYSNSSIIKNNEDKPITSANIFGKVRVE